MRKNERNGFPFIQTVIASIILVQTNNLQVDFEIIW